MIIGIGFDLTEVDRVDRLLRRHADRAIARLFTPAEVAYCECSRLPAESFAARFAAKEAAFKALGTGWGAGLGWTDIEILAADSGAPRLRLLGPAERLAASMGVRRAHVTLSHTRGLASAFVVLEGATD